MKEQADIVEVVVSVTDDHLASIRQVAGELARAGMIVEQTLAETGVITGRAPRSALEALAALPGVAAVEPAGSFQLPPSDAPIQ
jgi:hypothetical protein